MKINGGIQIARIAVLSFFLVLITVIATLHQIIGGGPNGAPSVDSLCPFGGIEIIYKYLISSGEFIKRTNISNFILLGGTIALAFIVGRFFCGWICMIGFLQEVFGKIGLMLFKKRFVIPVKFDGYLRFLKYIILFVVIFLTWKTGELIIRPYDPFAAYAHIPAGFSVFKDLFWGMVILMASMVSSMFVDRFFCKYLCPMGAFLGIANKLSFFRIKRKESTCIHCSKCSGICPVNIDVEKTDVVRSSECINCMECITVCPTLEKKTMSANIFGKFINLIFIVILGLGIYIGIIGISMITKIWKTQESSLSEAVNEGETLDPENIRGFMTMEEIAKTFNINVNDLYSELGITKNNVPVTSQMKKVGGLALKDGLNIGEDEIRNAVKKLAGKSLDKTEDKKDAVIKKDVPIEKDNEKNKTTTTAVTTTTKEINDKQDVNDEKKKTVDTKAESLPDPMTIKGTMTLKEIADNYKIDIDSLYEKLNLSKEKVPETTAGRDIKNILSNDGRTMEVQEIRDVVKELLKK